MEKRKKEDALGIEGNVSSKVCLFESISKGTMHRAFEQNRAAPSRPSLDLEPAFPAPARVVEGRADVLQRPDDRCDPNAETLAVHRLPGEPLGFDLEPQRDGQRWRIRSVMCGTPADRAGLRAGDDVTRINGVALAAESRADVMGLLSGLPLRVQLTVQRCAKVEQVVKLEEEEEVAESEEEEEEETVTRSKYHGRPTQIAPGTYQAPLAPGGRWKSESCDSLPSAGGDSMTSIDTLLAGDRDYLSRALGFCEMTVEFQKSKGEYMGVSVMNGSEAMVDYFQVRREEGKERRKEGKERRWEKKGRGK